LSRELLRIRGTFFTNWYKLSFIKVLVMELSF
jgi:hypothetical protein